MSKRKKYYNKYTPQASPRTSIQLTLPLGVLAGLVLLVVLIFIAYLPSLRGGFVFDDDKLLTENKIINASDGLYRLWFTTEAPDYWPVTNTTFWIEWRLWGMNSTGYHATNLLLHIVEALLIWIILRKLSIPGAFLAAMIFAVHPVNVESVAWIAQRKNMMAMLFFLLSIFWYVKMEMQFLSLQNRLFTPGAGRLYWLSIVAFVLAMLSKGSVAILPVLLLGIIWWLRLTGDCPDFPGTMRTAWSAKMGLSPLVSKWDLLRTAPFFLVAVVLTGVNLWFQTHGEELVIRTASFTERLLGAGGVVWFYLYKALLPFDLAFIYPQWHIKAGNWLWWLPLLGVLALTTVLWKYRKGWSRPFLFAWGFFCVSLVPVLGFSDVGFMKYSLVADHYQHIAIIGVITLFAVGFSLWQRHMHDWRHWIATALAVVPVVVLTVLTWHQSGLYSDSVTLYKDTLKKNPECWVVHNNLGVALVATNRIQEAYEHYQQVLRLKPDDPEAYHNMGLFLNNTGSPEEAIKHYQQALRLKPDYTEVHNKLALALVKTGQTQEAIKHYRQALRLKPDYLDAIYNLGLVLSQTGQNDEAIERFQQALRIDPDLSDAYCNLGNELVKANRQQEAIKYYQQALRLKSNFAAAHYNLAVILAKGGKLLEAIEHYQQALDINPDYPEAQNNLGITLVQLGRFQEAIEHFKQTLQRRPDSPDAHYNLGSLLFRTGRLKEAVDHYKQALRLKPDYIEAYNDLGAVLIQTNRPQEAIEHLKQALRLSPENINVLKNLTAAYAKTQQSAEAIATAKTALELAKIQGQTAQAKQIEDWLNNYQGAGKSAE